MIVLSFFRENILNYTNDPELFRFFRNFIFLGDLKGKKYCQWLHFSKLKVSPRALLTPQGGIDLYIFSIGNITTLTCQIIVQDHLIVQVADFSEIKKRVGLNKAVQDEFFLIYVGENQVLKEKYQRLINVQVQIRLCRCFFPQKLIRFAARLFGRSEYMKIPSSNLGRTCCVQKLFLTFRTIFVYNMFYPFSAKRMYVLVENI